MNEKVQGKVKWWSDAKGYGFVTPDQGGKDIFCHFSSIVMDGFKTLAENDKVEFEIIDGAKGKQTANLVKI